jgi:hypothetical protein
MDRRLGAPLRSALPCLLDSTNNLVRKCIAPAQDDSVGVLIGRPHMALGPGVPDPPPANIDHTHPHSRHCRGESYAVRAIPILDGLHHEYFLVPAAA